MQPLKISKSYEARFRDFQGLDVVRIRIDGDFLNKTFFCVDSFLNREFYKGFFLNILYIETGAVHLVPRLVSIIANFTFYLILFLSMRGSDGCCYISTFLQKNIYHRQHFENTQTLAWERSCGPPQSAAPLLFLLKFPKKKGRGR